MSLKAIVGREANLHGMEIMPGLDLRRSQRHRRAVMNAVKGNLLDMDRDVLEMSINEGTPSIDGIRGHVRRQLKRLQLHRLGWRLQRNIKTKAMKLGWRCSWTSSYLLPRHQTQPAVLGQRWSPPPPH